MGRGEVIKGRRAGDVDCVGDVADASIVSWVRRNVRVCDWFYGFSEFWFGSVRFLVCLGRR